MCSNGGGGGADRHDSAADMAARLNRVIEEVAAAVGSADQLTEGEVASRLAGAWAVVAAADPELDAHVARYGPRLAHPDSGSPDH